MILILLIIEGLGLGIDMRYENQDIIWNEDIIIITIIIIIVPGENGGCGFMDVAI